MINPFLKYSAFLIALSIHIANAKPTHQPAAGPKLLFIQNKGQWDNASKFMAKVPGGELYIEKNVFHFAFQHAEDIARAFKHPQAFMANFKEQIIRQHTVRISFLGASEDAIIDGQVPSSTYFNYYLGNNPEFWKAGVPGFGQVTMHHVYPQIDAQLYASQSGSLKYDLIVNPKANVSTIKLQYAGQDKLRLSKGNLTITTSVNSWIEQKPFAYQWINGQQVSVECAFTLNQNIVGFSVGNYDKTLPLIIDPELVFSTYSGSSVDNFGHSSTYDNDGNLYAAGIATSPTLFPNGRYPTTPGAFQQVWNGGVGQWPQSGFPCDMSISKYTPDGSALIYATYLGGSKNDYPHSLVADNANNLVVFGTTLSNNFPTKSGCFDSTFNDSFDIVVVKLSADGTQLLGSTYVGGSKADGINVADSLRMNYADEFRGEVIIDKFNDIVIATSTSSDNFPTTTGAAQISKSGRQDGCIFKLDSLLKTLKASTFLGQPENDAIYSLDSDSTGAIYFTGGTESTTFLVSPNTQLGNYKGGFSDGFVGKINSNLSSVLNFRYWGSNDYDQSYFVKLDPQSNPVIFGQHFDSIPIINALYHTPKSSLFITKFKPQLDSIIFSTSIGDSIKNNALPPSAFMVDECGVIYGSVWGGSTNLQGNFIFDHPTKVVSTTKNMPITFDALQSATDESDFYLFVLEKNADSLLYGTYFGENGGGDHVDGGTSRFDKKGIVYQSVCASCNKGPAGTFTTTLGSFSPNNLSPRCSNASLKIDFRKSNIVYAQFDYAPKKLCLDSYIVVTYTNQSYNGKYYRWYRNGVLKDTSFTFIDTFDVAGTYEIKLLAIDSSRCIIIDSFSVTHIISNGAQASFSILNDSCSNKITFTNTSLPINTPIKWYFGGGDTSSAQIVTRSFPANGKYQILLITNPGSTCADSAIQSIIYDSIGYLVRASFIPYDTVACEPAGFTFINTSNKFSNLAWYVNDTLASTSFVFDTVLNKGRFTIKLVSTDSATCNIIDSVQRNILIVPYLYPDFSYAQDTCSFRTKFTNTTLRFPEDTIEYFWDFGNGITSRQKDTTVTFDTAGIYWVTLITNPGLACEEVTTIEVTITILPGILNAYFVPIPPQSCTPGIITFENFSANAQQQQWFYNNILASTDSLLVDTFYTDTTLNVKLIVFSNITCLPVDSFDTVIVIQNNTQSSFNIVRDSCSAKVFFINTSTSDNGEPLSFFWFFGDGDSSTAQSPTHTFINDTTYTVTLITNRGSFCADTSMQTFNYNSTSHILNTSFTINDSVFCAPAIFTAINTSTNASVISWYVNNNLVSVDSIFTDTLMQPGKYQLKLIGTNTKACTTQDTAAVDIQNLLSGKANFSIARDSCSLIVQFINESVSPTGLPISFIWFFGDGDSSTAINPKHTYQQTNTFTITLITNRGSVCADTSVKTYFIDGDSTNEIIIPNVFTPNGDGLNDCYTIKGVSAKCDEYKVTIYNRWGTVCFKSTDPAQCWDGTTESGTDASPGVYFYIMEIKKRDQPKQEKNGTITLVRD